MAKFDATPETPPPSQTGSPDAPAETDGAAEASLAGRADPEPTASTPDDGPERVLGFTPAPEAIEMAVAEFSPETSSAKRISDMNRPDKIDTSRLSADSAVVGEDISDLARQAVDAIRKAADDFAAKAGIKTGEAVSAVKSAGADTVDSLGSIAGDARALTESGLDALGKTVGRNPVAALAIAAGTGLLLGLISRSDTRR